MPLNRRLFNLLHWAWMPEVDGWLMEVRKWMGEKEHFLLGCFYAQYSLGVSNTGESEKTLQSLGQKR